MLKTQQIKPFFSPAYFQRGQAYFNEQRVNQIDFPGVDEYVASVRGSGRQVYQVHIDLAWTAERLTDIEGYCSCPIGYNCKHVVAVLLALAEQETSTRQADLFGLSVDKWLYQLKAVKPEADSDDIAPGNELLLYLLNTRSTPTGIRIHVDTVKTRRRQDGSYATPARFNGNPDSQARFVQEGDRIILRLLHSMLGINRSYCWLEGKSGAHALDMLLDTGRCHWQDEQAPALRPAEALSTSLSWRLQPDATQTISAEGLDPSHVLLPLLPPRYIDPRNGDCGPLDCGLPAKIAMHLLASPPVSPEQVEKVTGAIRQLDNPDIPLPLKPDLVERRDVLPVPSLNLLNEDSHEFSDDDPECIALLTFDYAGTEVHPYEDSMILMRQSGDGFERIFRDEATEGRFLDELESLGLQADDFLDETDESLVLYPDYGLQTWVEFMLGHRERLEQQGWQINISGDFACIVDEARGWYADIEDSGNDWFGLEVGVDVDGENINLMPFLVNYLSQVRSLQDIRDMPDDYPMLLQRDNGRLLHIPFGRVRHIIDVLVELHDPDALDTRGRLRLSRYQGMQLPALDADGLSWSGAKRLRRLGEKLRDFTGIRQVKPPTTLKAELRDYQREGLDWLQFLREYDFGGVLADDMGLGKTVQTLAHLLVEKRARRADRPSLVVAPTSLMVNWKRETERFAPGLKVLVLHGPERKQHFARITEHDLVLTTYPLLSRDSDLLLEQEWHVVVLDEAQNIKNPKSKAALTASGLRGRQRLCLTGTPMENHLGELWSQFNFLMPGLLGDERRFRKLFRTPIEKQQDADRQRQLRDRVKPFMLRREKAAVASELPPKTEIITEVELDGTQRDLYETIRVSMHAKIKSAIAQKGMQRSHIIILDALLKLRQVCCHPQLLKLDSARKVKHSAKFAQLMEMLPELVEEGRRILLFSQFTSMLALIEHELVVKGIDFVKLTGQTRNREQPIDAFQSGQVPVFLISLKAGGAGLNLTAADTVIHYDPWWNPAAENQATDRAYRIGQDKPVFVYKMVTTGTVEEKIIDMQRKKQALADALFAGEAGAAGLAMEDLQALFGPLD